MGNKCHSIDKKALLRKKAAEPEIVKIDEKNSINNDVINFLTANNNNIDENNENFHTLFKEKLFEVSETLQFFNDFHKNQQIFRINEILTKPNQLKINKRASKYLPHVFSSGFEQFFLQNFPYYFNKTQKNSNFCGVKSDILNEIQQKIEEKKRKFNENNAFVLTKPEKINKKTQSNNKINKGSAIKREKKTEFTKKKTQKSQSFHNNNQKKNEKITNDSILRINLIPLIEKEKKDRALIFLHKKNEKKRSLSIKTAENSYYKHFSYVENKKNKEKIKEIHNSYYNYSEYFLVKKNKNERYFSPSNQNEEVFYGTESSINPQSQESF